MGTQAGVGKGPRGWSVCVGRVRSSDTAVIAVSLPCRSSTASRRRKSSPLLQLLRREDDPPDELGKLCSHTVNPKLAMNFLSNLQDPCFVCLPSCACRHCCGSGSPHGVWSAVRRHESGPARAQHECLLTAACIMHVTTYRGRRVDVESLERENDRGVDLLSEKVALLKQVGCGFQSGRCMQACSAQPQRSQSRVHRRPCPLTLCRQRTT